MALITLVNETKLKSLKFGGDRPQGGSSREPFIESAIPESKAGRLPRALTAATSILAKLPGITDPGIGLATQASLTDAVRLGKFFTTTQGLAFIAKQNVLSQIGVKTQASLVGSLNEFAYLPTSTLAQVGVNVFGGHLNKQGPNPFLGFGEPYTPDRYIDAAAGGSASRIRLNLPTRFLGIKLSNTRAINIPYVYPKISTQKELVDNRLIDILADTTSLLTPTILTYPGGPGSIAGIGTTLIRFATDRKGRAPLRTGDETSPALLGSYTWTRELVATSASVPALTASPLTFQLQDFRKTLRDAKLKGNPIIPSSSMASVQAPDYYVAGQTNIEKRVNLNNPADPNRTLSSYVTGTDAETYDIINLFPIYRSEIIPQKIGEKVNDLVKFRIAAIDNDNPLYNEYIHFRAFLGTITDSYNADWDSVQYMGRGDKLYSYKGFGRSLNMSWTVAAQSKPELVEMYKKLNFLASNLAPDYNATGYMRGPLVNLTVGGYLYEVPGFITGMTLEMSEEYPWEVGISDSGLGGEDVTVKELSQIIRVSNFSFTPIHRFVPQKQVNTYNESGLGQSSFVHASNLKNKDEQQQAAFLKEAAGAKGLGLVETYGPTRFISLDAGRDSNNYDNKYLNK